jgi:hypothetical protein
LFFNKVIKNIFILNVLKRLTRTIGFCLLLIASQNTLQSLKCFFRHKILRSTSRVFGQRPLLDIIYFKRDFSCPHVDKYLVYLVDVAVSDNEASDYFHRKSFPPH